MEEKATKTPPTMLTIRQVAKTGVLPEFAIRTGVKDGWIPHIMVGTKALVNFDKLVNILNNSEKAAPQAGGPGKRQEAGADGNPAPITKYHSRDKNATAKGNRQAILSVAAYLVPIMRYLNNSGVVIVDGDGVTIERGLFRVVFPDVKPKGCWYKAEFSGVQFRAMTGGKADE